MVSKNNSEENVSQKTSTRQDDYINGQQHKITLAAYYKAENRGVEPGQELNDWFEAEYDIMGNP
jgi:hypothetical protein